MLSLSVSIYPALPQLFLTNYLLSSALASTAHATPKATSDPIQTAITNDKLRAASLHHLQARC